MNDEKIFESLTGTVEKITYKNAENGFTVLKLSDGEKLHTVVGTMPDVITGMILTVWGEWTFHPSFGEQFRAEQCEMSNPVDEGAILQYLSSGVIKGIGASTATKIVERFGEDTLRVIEDEPVRLAEIKGISEKKAAEIGKEYRKRASMRDLMMNLGGYGITASECIRIYKKLGSDAVAKIKNDPYVLCSSGLGISFPRADEIAYRMSDGSGIESNRIKAGILYILKHNLGNGHTCIPVEQIYAPAANLLGAGREEVDEALMDMQPAHQLVCTEIEGREFLFSNAAYDAETEIARKIASMLMFSHRTDVDYSEYLNDIQRENNLEYDEMQREAILGAMANGVFILTGGPGTGKTTTLNAIIELMKRSGINVLLAAPTGRAAKRMTVVTGEEASTIHRMLEVEWGEDEDRRFLHNRNNPLKAEAVILDELSMVDIFLFNALLDALPAGCRLVMVGDSDQLPPVGAGNVLNDLLKTGLVPHVKLDKIFRQSRDSLIVTNAHEIVNGRYPNLDVKTSDFFFMRQRDASAAAFTVAELCAKRLPAAYGYSPFNDIQVLCPSRKGLTGTININLMLQAVLNPPSAEKAEIKQHTFVLREGDKVMQIKNNYDIIWTDEKGKEGMGIYNGDVGMLESVNLRENTLTVCFDGRRAVFPRELAADLELAYAITVHKSQGSEFEAVVMPVFGVPKFLCYRNILYTAVTRAKKLMIIAGDRESVEAMVDNDKKMRRYSALKYFTELFIKKDT